MPYSSHRRHRLKVPSSLMIELLTGDNFSFNTKQKASKSSDFKDATNTDTAVLLGNVEVSDKKEDEVLASANANSTLSVSKQAKFKDASEISKLYNQTSLLSSKNETLKYRKTKEKLSRPTVVVDQFDDVTKTFLKPSANKIHERQDKRKTIKQAVLNVTEREVPQIVVVEVPTEEQLIKKSWLLNPNKIPKPSNEVYVERVSTEINEDMVNLYRSRSLDIYDTSRRSYLSQWSRETTPIDSQDQYERNVRRSYTSIREFVQDARMPMSTYRYRSTPLNVTTLPYHSNYRYYQEQQPFRKYDIFQIRTWAYPIYK